MFAGLNCEWRGAVGEGCSQQTNSCRWSPYIFRPVNGGYFQRCHGGRMWAGDTARDKSCRGTVCGECVGHGGRDGWQVGEGWGANWFYLNLSTGSSLKVAAKLCRDSCALCALLLLTVVWWTVENSSSRRRCSGWGVWMFDQGYPWTLIPPATHPGSNRWLSLCLSFP